MVRLAWLEYGNFSYLLLINLWIWDIIETQVLIFQGLYYFESCLSIILLEYNII